MKYNKPIYREESDGGEGGDGGGGGNDGGGNEFVAPKLTDTLSPEFRTNASLADFANPDALAKGYMELKAYQGQSVHIPGEDAGEEAVTAFRDRIANVPGVMLKPDFDLPEQATQFYESIGKPTIKDDYTYAPPDDIGTDKLDAGRISQFQEIAFKHNLTKTQFQGVINDIVTTDLVAADVVALEKKEDQEALKGDWGQAFDQNMAVAAKVAELTGAPELFVEAVKDGNTNSGINRWLYDLSKKISGEGMNFNIDGAGESKMTPMEAREKISEMNNNKSHPYWNANDPANKDAIANMVELQRVANAGR